MDAEKFKKEVTPLRAELLAYATRLLKDGQEAEDIVQEVMVKMWRMRKELPRYNSVPALAMRITKNLSLNRIKALKRFEPGVTDGNLHPIEDTPYRALERKSGMENLEKVIDTLPPLQKTVLRMKHLDGLEVNEIAQVTGISPDAVRMNLSRARNKIKETILSGGYE